MNIKFLFSFAVSFLLVLQPVQAQTIQLMFDTETLAYLKDLATPLAKEGDLNINDIDFRIVVDENINAFVTPERKIYFNSGLLLKAETAENVQAVLAHELAHLKAQHHFRMMRELDRGKVPLILAGVLGIGAAVAGAPTAGTALIIGSQAGLTSNLLRYSRGHEVEADKLALKMLNNNGYSAAPMADFFEELLSNRLLYSRTPPPYLTTHPLSETRRASIQHHLDTTEKQLFAKTPPKQLDAAKFRRIQTKLSALTATPTSVLRTYGGGDDANSRYARTIAIARQGKLREALPMAQALLQTAPHDIFYAELIAQIYVEMGQAKAALPYFEQVLNSYPHLAIARLQYADALTMAQNYSAALVQLNRLKQDEPEWPGIYRKLGIALGKLGSLGESHLALAEEARLRANTEDLRFHLGAAKHYLKPPTSEQQQLIDGFEEALDEEK